MKLSELAVISAGQGAPQGESAYGSEGVPFIKAGDLASLLAGKKESEIQHVNESVAKKHKLKLYPAGSILFAKSGMSCMKGYVYKTENPCYVVSHLAIISPTRCNADFLKYYFQFHKPNSLVKDAAYPSISLADIGEMEINVPSLSKQQEIVAALENITELIAMRKEQLAKLDQLVKSRFIELFGDPVDNPKNYLVKSLQELIDMGYITYHLDGNHGGDYPRSEEFVDSGVPYIGANSIVNGEIDFSMAKYLTAERAGKLRKGIAQNEDVLFAHNATVGPTVVLHTTEPKVILSTSLTAYRCNKSQLLPNYLRTYMLSDGFIRQYSAEMKQTTRNQVPITAQKKYLFLVPPIAEQEQFATFVVQTDKSKLAIQQSIDKLEMLKKCLMQEYFG